MEWKGWIRMENAATTTAAAPRVAVVASRVPAELADQLVAVARQNCRSVSGEVHLALRRHLADQHPLAV
jgi:hypothetical protein